MSDQTQLPQPQSPNAAIAIAAAGAALFALGLLSRDGAAMTWCGVGIALAGLAMMGVELVRRFGGK